MKTFILLLLVSLTGGCATVKTLDPVYGHVNIEHRGKRSYCKEIPRVYSGVAYNARKLNGEPSRTPNWGNSLSGVPFFFFDTVFSAVADTVVIPYTAVQQYQKGNIKVN
ncbi:MAG TPA: YceK/YidQ family lipoprotein [Alteromonas sp.]|nr:YceK/YidQ family lipoprotein [Alteromonadaceae bacterium]HCA75688.1 YceK/YidQ family lipoprotein [Alteromonas sp.]HCV18387.1 YceK/YidQ family lipoprotein [Alteromonas sp.]|tara:strand:+ start:6647 stop:6973 length:327 start_codon:yes stop_codon:yes gene_type:complete